MRPTFAVQNLFQAALHPTFVNCLISLLFCIFSFQENVKFSKFYMSNFKFSTLFYLKSTSQVEDDYKFLWHLWIMPLPGFSYDRHILDKTSKKHTDNISTHRGHWGPTSRSHITICCSLFVVHFCCSHLAFHSLYSSNSNLKHRPKKFLSIFKI